ncbi:beta-galactosidase trimerization domain-containing protein, partial [Candidatus Symbiothrix dinenymphae]|uniref:beta-galactosidase trimerization domain-containing protein n=1 Tax=Candidatus Symbiothrix dinenymphae TaxID=467085 RepID=UPI000A5805A7
IVPCDQWSDFSQYKMLVIPPLYIATDALQEKIDRFVKDGGHVVMFFKSAFCNENSIVRPVLAPGPLRKACGFYYQEYANVGTMSLKDNPFHLKEQGAIGEWYEFLIPETAKPLAYADDPFFGNWPVITENNYGKGKLTYIGTYPSLELLETIVRNVAKEAGVTIPKSDLQFPVIVRSGKNDFGKNIRYVFNYGRDDKKITYPFPAGKSLLSGANIKQNEEITLKPWDVVIVEE